MSIPVEAGGLAVLPVRGLPEITEGAGLAALVAAHAPELADGDVIVMSSKIVSKAEGRVVPGDDREAAIDAEAVRLVARRGGTRVVETRHGFVMAAAGVDNSNVEPGRLVLLPLDPDASARRLRADLRARLGRTIGVIITDTFGRPWRIGQTDLAVGAAGVRVLDDHGGSTDSYGNPLAVTAPAHADEIASAAELVMGKLGGVPAAVVRGLPAVVTPEDGPGVRALVRGSETDMFRLGTRDAFQEAARLPRGGDELGDGPVDPAVVRTALLAAPLPAGLGLELVEVGEDPLLGKLLVATGLPGPAAYAVVPFLPAAANPSTLLAAGAAVDALLLAGTAYGLATRWTLPRDLDLPAVRALLDRGHREPRDPLGVLLFGARAG